MPQAFYSYDIKIFKVVNKDGLDQLVSSLNAGFAEKKDFALKGDIAENQDIIKSLFSIDATLKKTSGNCCTALVFYNLCKFLSLDGSLIGMAYDGKKTLFTTHSLCQNVQDTSAADSTAFEASLVTRDFPYKGHRWSIVISQTSNEAIVPPAEGMLSLILAYLLTFIC